MKEVRQNTNRCWFINDDVIFKGDYALVRAVNQNGNSGWGIINKKYQEAFDNDYFKFENHIDLVKVYDDLIITRKLYYIHNKHISEYKMWIINENKLEEIKEEDYFKEIFKRSFTNSLDIAVISDRCVIRKLDLAHYCFPVFRVCSLEGSKLRLAKDELNYLWVNLPNVTELKQVKSKIIHLKNYI